MIKYESGTLLLLQAREKELMNEQKQLQEQVKELKQDPEKDLELASAEKDLQQVETELAANQADQLKEQGKGELIESQKDGIEEVGKILGIENIEQGNTQTKTEVQIYTQQHLQPELTNTGDLTTAALLATGVMASAINEALNKDNDPAKDWAKDIQQQQDAIEAKNEKAVDAVNLNEVNQEIYARESGKFSQDEQKDLLNKISKIAETEREQLAEQMTKELNTLQPEKEAYHKAMESTKNMPEEQRREEIQHQRAEFERQRDLDRDR